MKKVLYKIAGIFFVVLSFFSSCEEKNYYGDVDCSECYYPKPDSAYMELDISADAVRGVPLVFYRGNVEEGMIDYIDTAFQSRYKLWVAVGVAYAVKAEYYANADTVYVVGGTTVEARKVPDACDNVCYIIDKNKLDMRVNKRYD